MRDRLDVVLRVRTIQERFAAGAAARAFDTARRASEEHDRLAALHARRPTGGRGLSSADLVARRVAGLGTARAVAESGDVSARADAHHQQAVTDHRGRLVQRRAAERMTEHHAAVARREADRVAQRLLDDVAVQQWTKP